MGESNSEGAVKLNTVDVVEAIKTKAWYGRDPSTGAFSWDVSMAKLAGTCGLGVDETKNAFRTAFTPDCLSKVTIAEKGEEKEIPLIEALKNQGVEMYVWTVGDKEWQKTKYRLTGANAILGEEKCIFAPKEKVKELEKLIASKISSTVASKEVSTQDEQHFLVVDDKSSNLAEVMEMAHIFEGRGVTVGNYHMKLHEPGADAQALYEFVIDEIRERNNNLTLILDFDGVIADSDSVIFGKATDNISRLVGEKAEY